MLQRSVSTRTTFRVVTHAVVAPSMGTSMPWLVQALGRLSGKARAVHERFGRTFITVLTREADLKAVKKWQPLMDELCRASQSSRVSTTQLFERAKATLPQDIVEELLQHQRSLTINKSRSPTICEQLGTPPRGSSTTRPPSQATTASGPATTAAAREVVIGTAALGVDTRSVSIEVPSEYSEYPVTSKVGVMAMTDAEVQELRMYLADDTTTKKTPSSQIHQRIRAEQLKGIKLIVSMLHHAEQNAWCHQHSKNPLLMTGPRLYRAVWAYHGGNTSVHVLRIMSLTAVHAAPQFLFHRITPDLKHVELVAVN